MNDLALEPSVNAVILRLYREARQRPPHQFRGWAMAQLQDLVDFDSAFWIEAYPSWSLRIHTEFFYNLPEEMMANYWREGIVDRDILRQAALSEPGTTFRMDSLINREAFLAAPMYQQHCRHYGMEWAMSTAVIEDRLGLITFFSVFQSDPERPFTERERAIKETVSPHMVEAYRTALFFHLARLDLAEDAAHQGVALVDGEGVIYQASERFADLVVQANPEWEGPRLPHELLEAFPVSGAAQWAGLVWEIQPAGGDLMVVRNREPSPIETLSASEHRVAGLVASGMSYKEAARDLGRSPSTVTNHLNRIYKKLGVTSKAELADCLARHGSLPG